MGSYGSIACIMYANQYYQDLILVNMSHNSVKIAFSNIVWERFADINRKEFLFINPDVLIGNIK